MISERLSAAASTKARLAALKDALGLEADQAVKDEGLIPAVVALLTDEDARQILHSVTGFFGVLAEWRRAELFAAANDCAAPIEPNDGEVRHDR